jgi:hypothetical protein
LVKGQQFLLRNKRGDNIMIAWRDSVEARITVGVMHVSSGMVGETGVVLEGLETLMESMVI